MTIIKLSDAKAHLSELIDRVQAGETVCITRHGETVAQLIPAEPARKPINFAELKTLTDAQSKQGTPAAELVRAMRDESRY